MRTLMMLMAQYDGIAVVPLEKVCKDYFTHLTPSELARKISRAEVRLPMVRMEDSQKAAKGVHLTDLASYLDDRAESARRELRQLSC